jgi:hypothetical protein
VRLVEKGGTKNFHNKFEFRVNAMNRNREITVICK